MLTGKLIRCLIVPVLLGLFGFALWQLMQLRFQSGDIYPEYSSLRADPFGAKALYEALGRMPRVETSRHFLAPSRLHADTNSTLFFLGASDDSIVHESAETMENLARDGARIVVSWSSVVSHSGRRTAGPPPPKTKTSLEKKKEASVLEPIFTGTDTNHFNADGRTSARLNTDTAQDLPGAVPWLSPRYFHEATNGWNVLYRVGTNAVMIEQKIGKGSILMATDSYFLSNEAMRNHRATELIAYFVGNNRKVIFSEWHLGIEHGTGIAVLARQYRLHGFAIGLLLLVGFYIWRNAVPFVPVYEEERSTTNEVASDKSAREAFLTLLQKNIPPHQVLETCFQEWRKIDLAGKKSMPEKRKEMELVIIRQNDFPAKERDPVAGYKEMAAILEKEEP